MSDTRKGTGGTRAPACCQYQCQTALDTDVTLVDVLMDVLVDVLVDVLGLLIRCVLHGMVVPTNARGRCTPRTSLFCSIAIHGLVWYGRALAGACFGYREAARKGSEAKRDMHKSWEHTEPSNVLKY